jgi:hypothetical protein
MQVAAYINKNVVNYTLHNAIRVLDFPRRS